MTAEKREKYIQEFKNKEYKCHLVRSLSSDEIKEKYIQEFENEWYKFQIVLSLSSDEIKEKYIQEFENEEYKCQIMATLSEEKREECFKYLKQGDLIKKLYTRNRDLLEHLNLNILDSKYLSIFGEERINEIACFPDVQKMILQLNDDELEMFSICLNHYNQYSNNNGTWRIITQKILQNIGGYNKLIQSIKGKEIDIEKLVKLLQTPNEFDITSLEEFENLEDVIRQRCEEKIQSNEASLMQEAVIRKIFGHSKGFAHKLINKYRNTEKLDNDDLILYIKSLKEILSEKNPAILREIFYKCEEKEFIDEVKIERILKAQYTKKLNEGLFRIEKGAKTPEEGIYEAGTDFKMIIHSVNAFFRRDNQYGNFQESWNRPQVSSAHFCTSYIRNDMIATAPIKYFCYGFNCMEEDSLILAGPVDIYSSYEFSSRAGHDEAYYMPEELVIHTGGYNELDYLRYQNGAKKQPDYIVVLKKDGIVQNLELAKQAAKDWGGMPIVIVDEDKCLESEKSKVEQMLMEYEKTKDPKLARKICQKVRNNRHTKRDFCSQINLEELKKESEKETEISDKEQDTKTKVTLGELKRVYEDVSPEERASGISNFYKIYKFIKTEKESKTR